MNLKLTSFLLRPQPIRGNRPPISEKQPANAKKEQACCPVGVPHSRQGIFRNNRALVLVALLLASLLFPLIGCNSNDVEARKKLDSQLRQLIDAEKRGEAESFAQLHRIDLVDGSVEVAIECQPGQCEAATKAVSRVGIITHEADRWEKIGALVPITKLTALAGKESIRFIRLPVKSVPES